MTLSWSFNGTQGQMSWGKLKDNIWFTIYVFHAKFDKMFHLGDIQPFEFLYVFLINYGQNVLSLWNIASWKRNDLDLPCQFHQRSNVKMWSERPYMTYYMYFIQTLIIWCTVYEKQPLERSATLIWPLNVIQCQRSQGQLKYHIWLYMCFIQTLVTACTISEIL